MSSVVAAEDEAVAGRQLRARPAIFCTSLLTSPRGGPRRWRRSATCALEIAPVDLRGAERRSRSRRPGATAPCAAGRRRSVLGGEPDRAAGRSRRCALVGGSRTIDVVVLAVGRAPAAGLRRRRTAAAATAPTCAAPRCRGRRRRRCRRRHRQRGLGRLHRGLEVDEARDRCARAASRPRDPRRAPSMSWPCSDSWSCFCSRRRGRPMLIETSDARESAPVARGSAGSSLLASACARFSGFRLHDRRLPRRCRRRRRCRPCR